MLLTQAQKTALKNHIAANTNTITRADNGQVAQIKDVPDVGDNYQRVADWYNGAVTPTYLVWRPDVSVSTIRAAVDLSKFTPSDTPPASTNNVTGTNDALLYQNRAMLCQLKQGNCLFLIQGNGQLDCTSGQLRGSFADCLRSIPAGAAGAAQDAGWGANGNPQAVRTAMQRPASNVEKLFSVAGSGGANAGNVAADARGSSTNPDALVVYGSPLTGPDVSDAIANG